MVSQQGVKPHNLLVWLATMQVGSWLHSMR